MVLVVSFQVKELDTFLFLVKKINSYMYYRMIKLNS